MDVKFLGKIVRLHRKAAGLSREACARLAGVGKTVIYDIEHGKETVQFKTLLLVLQVLNISIRLESPFMQKFEHAES